MAPTTEVFTPASRSVGIHCPGQPRRTPHGAPPASAWGAADEEMRNSSFTARGRAPGVGCRLETSLDGYAWKTRIFVHGYSCFTFPSPSPSSSSFISLPASGQLNRTIARGPRPVMRRGGPPPPSPITSTGASSRQRGRDAEEDHAGVDAPEPEAGGVRPGGAHAEGGGRLGPTHRARRRRPSRARTGAARPGRGLPH